MNSDTKPPGNSDIKLSGSSAARSSGISFFGAFGREEAIAFLGGAAVMVFEIAGSRVLAPFLGTSVFVWTTLIGVIMASLSLGYWWGGRLADRSPTHRRLAAVLFLAAIFAGFTAAFQEPILLSLREQDLEIRLSALLATLLLFAPASTMLGMVTPFVVRLKLRAIESSGAEVGRLYAISTAGSIVGTFACGYFLLSLMGTSRILFGIALSLLALSFLAAAEWRVVERVAAIVFLLLSAALAEQQAHERAAAGFRDLDTAYQRVQIIDSVDPGSQRPVRVLKAEEQNAQSSIYLDGNDLRGDYLQSFEMAGATERPLRRVLMIGAAGYVYPQHLLRKWPGLEIDVVEIDPVMTKLAEAYFGLRPDPRLHIFHADGRTFIESTAQRYDAIYVDAFQSRVPPFHLLTAEFAQALKKKLQPHGIVALNFIARLEPRNRGLTPAIVSTFRSALPTVALIQVDETADPGQMQNLVLLAAPDRFQFSSTTDTLLQSLQEAHDRAASLRDGILTDDFAPVEYLAEIR